VTYDRGAIDARLSGPSRSSNFHTLREIAGGATIPTDLLAGPADANTTPAPPEIFLPEPDPNQQFRLTYKGLYCKDETNWDGATNSDEIYLITTVIGVDDNGQNVVRTERHPLTTTCYSDVDRGESRVGPVAAVWQGKNERISLMVHCFEHDYGDPNKYKAEIELATRAAVTAAAAYGFDPTNKETLDLLERFANWLFDTEDDAIDTTVHVFHTNEVHGTSLVPLTMLQMKRSMVRMTGMRSNPIQPYTVTDDTNILQNFTMEHKGSGADYISCYEMTKV
jgi:hypothetical protein